MGYTPIYVSQEEEDEAEQARIEAERAHIEAEHMRTDAQALTSSAVPQGVAHALADHLAELLAPTEHAGLNGAPDRDLPVSEDVFFCEPPNGMSSRRVLTSIIMVTSLAMYIALLLATLFRTTRLIPALAGVGLEVAFLWLVVFACRWNIFGFRVVTNHRVALVIPNNILLISKPGVTSSFFRPALEKLSRGEFNFTQDYHLAHLEHGRGRSGDGTVVINGNGGALHFGHVSDIQLLERVLVNRIQNFLRAPGFPEPPHFEMRTILEHIPGFKVKMVGIFVSAVLSVFAVIGGIFVLRRLHNETLASVFFVMAFACAFLFISAAHDVQAMGEAVKHQRSILIGNFQPKP